MTIPMRDLASPTPWERSMQRSRRRRAITPDARKRLNRRRRASTALTTLMVAGPAGQILAGVTGQGTRALAASPVDRAIGGEVGGLMLLKVGSTGAAVEAVQERLRVPADGIYGPVTERAVRDFQSRSGILIDGVVGPVTWTELFGLERAAASAGTSQGAVAVVVRELEPGEAARGASARASAVGEAQTRPAVQRTAGDREAAEPQTEPGAPGGVEPGPDAGEKAPAGDDVQATPPTPSEPAPPAATTCATLRLASPVRGVRTSPFGPRWGRSHDGVDIAAAMGTAVRAAECGVVTTRGVQGGYGNMVCVKHSARFETCYAHLSSFAVNAGQTVRRGQVIGYVGCTGSCTGPHLHFETRVDGQARNPDTYLGGAAVPGKPTVRPAPRARAAKATSRQSSRSGWQPARTAVGGAPAARTAKPAPSPQAADPPSVEAAAPVVSPAPVPSAPEQVGTAAPAAPVTEPAPAPVAPQPVVEETPAPMVAEQVPEPVPAEPQAAAPVGAPPEPAPVEAGPVAEPEAAPPVEAEPIAQPEDIATAPEEVPAPEAEAQTEAPAPEPSTP